MAMVYISTDDIAAGNRVVLGTTNDATVLAGVNVISTDAFAIVSTGSNQSVTVLGTVGSAGTAAIRLGDNFQVDDFLEVTIGATGVVTAANIAIQLNGSASKVVNHGSILSDITGIEMIADGSYSTSITNFGTISGDTRAIKRGTGGDDSLTITNHGTIWSASIAIDSFNVDAVEVIRNTGSISGLITLGLGEDTYDGRGGTLFGNIQLGGGNDMLDNRGGTISGDILGGAGNDVFTVGAGDETIYGGTDVDSLDFKGGGAVVVALDGGLAATGFALNDSYFDIENIYGSVSGADVLRGNSANNALVGRGGADTLTGMAGDDVFIGGLGIDALLGSAGNDSFRFYAASEGGDKINDFSASVAGNNDRIQFKGTGFGAGLVVGAIVAGQFQSRTDNVAQDATDRFIFRTTDKTLWFDSNGNAAGGLVLIADLQATATMTFADIFVI